MRCALVAFLAAVGLVLASASPSVAAGTGTAAEALPVVHTEQVDVGPYPVTVGFTEWPVRAMQSLDITIVPEGGREGLTGSVEAVAPEGSSTEELFAFGDLSRHPRQPQDWGLDVVSLPDAGPWVFAFTIDGPQGRGVGELSGIEVLPQPGPPIALSWAVAGFPVLLLLAFLAVAWRRTRLPREQLVAV